MPILFVMMLFVGLCPLLGNARQPPDFLKAEKCVPHILAKFLKKLVIHLFFFFFFRLKRVAFSKVEEHGQYFFSEESISFIFSRTLFILTPL